MLGSETADREDPLSPSPKPQRLPRSPRLWRTGSDPSQRWVRELRRAGRYL